MILLYSALMKYIWTARQYLWTEIFPVYSWLTFPETSVPRMTPIPGTGHVVLNQFPYYSTDSSFCSLKVLFLGFISHFSVQWPLLRAVFLNHWESKACLFYFWVTRVLPVTSNCLINKPINATITTVIICQHLIGNSFFYFFNSWN